MIDYGSCNILVAIAIRLNGAYNLISLKMNSCLILQEEEEDFVESDEDNDNKPNQASHNKEWRKTSKKIF